MALYSYVVFIKLAFIKMTSHEFNFDTIARPSLAALVELDTH